ncbi:MAG: DUF2807 domain-containing protein [Bacteroidales bacterium]|nr:DUF2807 domain-containing protein [Bacteroidales bacterium]
MRQFLCAAVALAVITAVSATSCDNPDLPDMLKKEGAPVTDTVRLAPFSNLDVDGNMILHLVKDSDDFAVTHFGKNLIKNVSCDYYDDASKLIIHNKTTGNIVRNNRSLPTVELHYSQLSTIYTYANVLIESSDSVDVERYVFAEQNGQLDILSNADNLDVEVWDGAAVCRVRGKRDRLYLEARYTSVMDASNLDVRCCRVANYSTGDVTVSPRDTLEASILWTGDILYSGNPVLITVQKTGKGNVVHYN